MEQAKKLIILESKPIIHLQNNIITAIDYLEHYIYVGTKNGTVLRYKTVMNPKNSQVSKIGPPERVANFENQIEKLICVNAINQIIVLAGHDLNTLNHLQSLSKIRSKIIQKKCVKFAMNLARKKVGQMIVIAKGKNYPDMYFYSFDQNSGIFKRFSSKGKQLIKDASELNLPQVPREIQFYDQTVAIAFKAEYHLTHFFQDKGEKNEPLKIPIPLNKRFLISVIRDNEFLMLTVNEIGICVNIKGILTKQSTFQFKHSPESSKTEYPIQDIHHHKDYLVVLYEQYIQIFSLSTSKLLQEISKNVQMAKCLSKNGPYLFYSDRQKIYHLALTPYQKQIQQLLSLSKYDDALIVFNQNTQKDDYKLEQKLEQLNIDAGFYLLKNLDFKQSLAKLEGTNFDIRELIILFPNYIPKAKNSLQKVKPGVGIVDIIQKRQELFFHGKPKEQQAQQKVALKKSQSEFLLQACLAKRKFLLQKSDYETKKNQEVLTQSSEASFYQNQFRKITLKEMVELIDFVVIAIFENFKVYVLINEFFDKKVYIDKFEDEIRKLITRKWQKKAVMAKFYKQVGNIQMAVQQWKDLSSNQQTQKEACKETVKLLRVLTSKHIIFDSLSWLFQKETSDYVNVFENISKDVILPDVMLEFLDNIQYEKQKMKLKQKYLKSLINNNSENLQDKYYTKLGQLYIEDILDLKAKDQESKFENHPKKQEIQMLIDELDDFLRKPNQRYQASTLLDQINDSWLLHQEIYLLGKEKKHKEALSKLINKSQFELAEEYCTSKNDNLLTDLFHIYVEAYQKQIEAFEKDHDPVNKSLYEDFRQRIFTFLKKYPRHSELDTMKTIELIPDDFILSQKDGQNNIFRFLHSVISHQLHEKRMYQCTKQISEINKLHIDSKLTLAKKAHVKITQDKQCVYCQKKIGDTVFAVYPNGIVARHKCVGSNNQHICPKTKQNFLKTFKFE